MAEVKITDLVELNATPDDADLLEIVDVGGTPTSKKITVANLRGGLAAAGANADITSMTGLDDDGIPYAAVYGAGNLYFPDYNETDQGLTGSGKSAKAYIDTISTNSATLVFRHNSGAATTTYTFSTDETIPSNIKVVIEKGAILSIANLKTLTINGPFEAGLYQVFSGDGAVVMGSNLLSPHEVYVTWWGATGDGSTNDTAAVQAAIDSLPGSGIIYFPVPTTSYFVNRIYLKKTGQQMIGIGGRVTLLYAGEGSDNEAVLEVDKTTYNGGENYKDMLIQGFIIDGNDKALYGLKLDGFTRRCKVTDSTTINSVCGLWLINSYYASFERVEFQGSVRTVPSGMTIGTYNDARYGTYLNLSHRATFRDCLWYTIGGGGYTITNITNANPAVVTATNSLTNGQTIYISGVSGMTEVNTGPFTVANASGTSFELSGIDSSGYGAYTSGGIAENRYTAVARFGSSEGVLISQSSFEEMQPSTNRYIADVVLADPSSSVKIDTSYMEILGAAEGVFHVEDNAILTLSNIYMNNITTYDVGSVFLVAEHSPVVLENVFGENLDVQNKLFEASGTGTKLYAVRFLGATSFMAGSQSSDGDGSFYDASGTANSEQGMESDPIVLDNELDNGVNAYIKRGYGLTIDPTWAYIKITPGDAVVNGQVVQMGRNSGIAQRLYPDLSVAATWNVVISGAGAPYIERQGAEKAGTGYVPVIGTFVTAGDNSNPTTLVSYASNIWSHKETMLASATVDLQNGDSKTTLITSPVGESIVVTKVVIHSPTASLAGGTEFDIGSGALADTWRQNINLSSMTLSTDYMVIPSIAATPVKYRLEIPGAEFGIRPVTGATADAQATMDVYGYME